MQLRDYQSDCLSRSKAAYDRGGCDKMGMSRCYQHRDQASIVKGHDMTPPSEDYRLIPLSRGQTAIVDAADYERLASFSWYAHWGVTTKSFYARTGLPRSVGKQRQVLMHRMLLGLTDPRISVDHVNGITTDNRRCNLRIADHSKNGGNRGKPSLNTSGYKGVSWHKQAGKWRAQIVKNKTHHDLGLFTDPAEAHRAYCAAADELQGEFARHN